MAGTTRVEARPGVWIPLATLAKHRPVLQDLLSVRYGQSYGDQAYRCRIVIWADAGYPDPGYWVVSAGLRGAIWPASLITPEIGGRDIQRDVMIMAEAIHSIYMAYLDPDSAMRTSAGKRRSSFSNRARSRPIRTPPDTFRKCWIGHRTPDGYVRRAEEWRGSLTVDRLKTLKSYGLLQ